MKKEEDNHDRFGLYSLRKINNKKTDTISWTEKEKK